MTSSRLRYLLVATHVPWNGAGGGMVRYAMEMARGLAARDDVELHVLAAAGAAEAFTGLIDPDRVHRAPGHGAVGAVLERVAGARGDRAGMDVVHGTKHLLPRGIRGVGVLTVHDMLAFDRPYDFGRRKRWLLRAPYLASLRQADVLLCVSAATLQRLTSYLPSSAARASVVRHPERSSLADVEPEPEPALFDRCFALVVGDPSPRKNVGLVVDAWQRVRVTAPDAVLVVVGPDSWGPTNRGRAFSRLTAEGAVMALGHVPDARLRWLYEHARVVLCPSLAEGFGLPAAEALAFGAPVIASEDPALAEAAGGRAVRLPARRPEIWADAVLPYVRGTAARVQVPPLVVGGSPRQWSDVVEDSLEAVRRVIAR